MTRKLYDLCAEDAGVRFSPFCWIAKFALLHKGLEFEAPPLRFTEKQNYPDPDYGKLPMLEDGGALIKDSAEIIAYLEKTYPEKPFFRSDGERAMHQFLGAFLGAHLFPSLGPLLFARVHGAISPEDQAYFRQTREERFGVTLEALAAKPGLRDGVEAALATLAAPLSENQFYGGAAANLSDYQLASILMWRRSVAGDDLYETPKPVEAWFERMLDLFDGYARSAPRAV
ncbi:MAG: glutathione S-transferase N-terminal domain-containing protein [Pseudomonadota bacterium]